MTCPSKEGICPLGETVFWSWQNDLPSKTNRAFLREALAVAVDRVSDELEVEDVERLDLDHDTKATPGMADISQTILAKISKSAVVVADVTPIAKSEKGKALPNPNVMIELGYALHALSFERIIAVLNTACGFAVEDLPFDIRHRRILTYNLSEDAPKNERRKVREALIKQLVDAIQTNIKETLANKSAAEPIEGVECDPHSPGLWKSDWPVTHSDGLGEVKTVRPLSVSRAWMRIIPASYPKGWPAITEFDRLQDSARLWPPSGGGSGGNFGSCCFGYLTYSVAGLDEYNTHRARNLAAFLEETGEVWFSDGSVFTDHQNQKFISSAHLLTNWARGIARGMACLDALGASKRRRVIIGVEGMERAVWYTQEGYPPARSRKNGLCHEEILHDWQQEHCVSFLRDGWNRLLDAFSLPQVSNDEFAEYYAVRVRS